MGKRENGSGRRAVDFDSAARRRRRRRRRAGNRLRSSVSLFVLLLEERKESFHPYLSSGVVGVVERGSEGKKMYEVCQTPASCFDFVSRRESFSVEEAAHVSLESAESAAAPLSHSRGGGARAEDGYP